VSLRAAKRWEPARFAEAAGRLHARTGGVFALVGGPGEEDDLRATASRMTGVPHVVRTFARLGGIASVLAGADLYLGNDNGPRHVAVALGLPTVAWFGGRNPGVWTPPGSDRHCVLWNPARGDGSSVRADLRVLPERPEAAAEAAAELLAAAPRRAAT
jgi:ADP-heptose:LPS heptosyltransferase